MSTQPTPSNTGKSFQTGRQLAVYRAGHQTRNNAIPFSFEAMEAGAKTRLSPESYDWIAGGAGRGEAMRENLAAFQRWRIAPRMACDISQRDWSIDLFGKRIPFPVLIAPIGLQQVAHPEGELGTARAAAELGIPFTISTVASYSMEEVAKASGDNTRWYQLYWSNDVELNRSLVTRAEKAGYSAIVVTLDTQSLGWRETNLQLGHLPFLQMRGLNNYITDPVFRAALSRPPEEDIVPAVEHYLKVFSDLRRTWKDLAQLRAITKLPILIKGIQRGDDARLALDNGASGIVVSNHGGRQVEGGVATLDALVEVLEAVKGRAPVLIDSGIRRGCDVFRALALGANAVMVGRPFMWALAHNGQAGVSEWLNNFLADFDLTAANAGKSRVADITRDDLRRVETPNFF